jgi:hypothetical protein
MLHAERSKISTSGMEFLKCAFASPDFNLLGARGVPDNYTGQTLMYDHNLTTTVTADPDADTWYWFSPEPGVAYHRSTTPIGGLPVNWTTVYLPGAAELFVSGTTSVTSFRHVSLAGELICAMNDMTWNGTVQCAKVPIKYATVPELFSTSPGTSNLAQLSGFVNLNNIYQQTCYTGTTKDGVYSIATNREPTFEFTDINEPLPGDPLFQIFTDLGGGAVVSYGPTAPGTTFNGFGNLDSIFVKVSVPADAIAQSFILRHYSCVEYTVNPQSLLAGFAHPSCPHDQNALDAYSLVANTMPTAVPSRMNNNFWKRVLNILNSAIKSASYVPGPIGMVAAGANAFISSVQAGYGASS